MKANKLTPWYPGDVKPVRVGVYERCHAHGNRFSYWDGEYWCGWAQSPQAAKENMGSHSFEQYTPWRGLKEQA